MHVTGLCNVYQKLLPRDRKRAEERRATVQYRYNTVNVLVFADERPGE